VVSQHSRNAASSTQARESLEVPCHSKVTLQITSAPNHTKSKNLNQDPERDRERESARASQGQEGLYSTTPPTQGRLPTCSPLSVPRRHLPCHRLRREETFWRRGFPRRHRPGHKEPLKTVLALPRVYAPTILNPPRAPPFKNGPVLHPPLSALRPPPPACFHSYLLSNFLPVLVPRALIVV